MSCVGSVVENRKFASKVAIIGFIYMLMVSHIRMCVCLTPFVVNSELENRVSEVIAAGGYRIFPFYSLTVRIIST